MYYLDPEDYGEIEVTGDMHRHVPAYLGGLFRKSKVDEDVRPVWESNRRVLHHLHAMTRDAVTQEISTQAPPAADLPYPAGSAPACREVSLVLNLATNADGVEDPQPIFDYAATGRGRAPRSTSADADEKTPLALFKIPPPCTAPVCTYNSCSIYINSRGGARRTRQPSLSASGCSATSGRTR